MFQQGVEVSTIRINAWVEYRNSMLKDDIYMRERERKRQRYI